MTALSGHFLRAATLYALIGMALGIHMASSHDHSQMPTHAHIMLLGWVSMGLYGLFYRGLAEGPVSKLMQVHRWLAHIGLIGLVVALYGMFAGYLMLEPLAAISSIVVFIAMVLFTVIVFQHTKA
ncbi:hypothetical protein [Kordiimonas aestuarii]|uniref:hypothetical protein n=1 Tax=Kordiimonas aestuarii TaxID=1005925 RepID=UPI0021D380B8|nr:hypothetical protein [Kordiimonas aestuarii]